MNTMTISFVLVRLAAAFLFVRGVQGLSAYSFILIGDAQSSVFAVLTIVFGVLMPLSVAIVLWLYPEKVAGAQVVREGPEEALTAAAIMMIGISLLGLYVAIYGVVDLVHFETLKIAQAKMAVDMDLPNEALSTQAIASRATYAVKILLGVCLILGRNGLTRLLLKAKYGGLAVSSKNED